MAADRAFDRGAVDQEVDDAGTVAALDQSVGIHDFEEPSRRGLLARARGLRYPYYVPWAFARFFPHLYSFKFGSRSWIAIGATYDSYRTAPKGYYYPYRNGL